MHMLTAMGCVISAAITLSLWQLQRAQIINTAWQDQISLVFYWLFFRLLQAVTLLLKKQQWKTTGQVAAECKATGQDFPKLGTIVSLLNPHPGAWTSHLTSQSTEHQATPVKVTDTSERSGDLSRCWTLSTILEHLGQEVSMLSFWCNEEIILWLQCSKIVYLYINIYDYRSETHTYVVLQITGTILPA